MVVRYNAFLTTHSLSLTRSFFHVGSAAMKVSKAARRCSMVVMRLPAWSNEDLKVS